MTDKALARPPQVTMAGWVTIVGSIFVVFSVFDVIANLRSIDTRERVAGSLADPPFSGMGLDLQQVLDFLHLLAMVAGASAAAAAILGWFVLRRHRQARLALTVVAVPLFLAGMVAGGFLSSMVAVAAVLLWTRPARDWFDGKPPARDDRTGPPPPPPPSAGGPPSRSERSGDDSAPPHPSQVVTDVRPPPYSGYAAPARPAFSAARPREVLQACLLTWVFSGLVLTASAVAVLGILADPGLVRDAMESDSRYADAGIGEDLLRNWVIGSAVLLSAWSLAAILLAVFTFLGQNWARVALIVSASVAALLSLVGILGSPLVVLFTLACALTVFLLTRPAAGAWFTKPF